MNQDSHMSPKKKKSWMGIVAISLSLLMAGAAFTVTLSGSASQRHGIAFAEDTATPDMLGSPFKGIYEQLSPSVVGIEVTTRTNIFGGRISASSAYVGSGVVISDDGYVLTNYHVIEGGEGYYVVSGTDSYPAEYVAGDKDSDVAVLKVRDAKLPPAKLGNSDALTVGDWALVIGNPLGQQFANTLTVGVISGLGRDLSDAGSRSPGATNMIQTNAAINAGNSGGGLFNIAGELVGVTSMKLSNNGYYGYASIEGIGLAIPINAVKTIANDLIAYGKVLYPRIGVSMRELTSPSMEPTDEMLPRSVWVTAVEKGAPADVAGIRADDLIMEVDGIRVTTANQVQSAIRGHQIGEKAEITVYRIPGLTEIKVDEKIPNGTYHTFQVEIKVLE